MAVFVVDREIIFRSTLGSVCARCFADGITGTGIIEYMEAKRKGVGFSISDRSGYRRHLAGDIAGVYVNRFLDTVGYCLRRPAGNMDTPGYYRPGLGIYFNNTFFT